MTFVARLGEGGMASVYLAAIGEGSLSRLAAVKQLRSEVPDHDYRTRFMDEAKLVVRLHHNNLVDVRAAGEVDGQLYIAMEAIDGRDLADIIDRCAATDRRIPLPLAAYIIRELLRGLHYAHTAPGLSLVHRDVSPSNILIDWAGAVRLADFGLATSTLKAATTVPGIVFGKVGYMAPEQALREELDPRADVYAAGVILWELLTGRLLRAPERTDTDVVASFVARPPSLFQPQVDAELDRIVLKALERQRERRFASAREMLDALGAWMVATAPHTSQETLAEFLAEIYAGQREIEAAHRDELLRDLYQDWSPATSKREATDALAPSRAAAGKSPGMGIEEVDETIEPGTIVVDRYRVLNRLGRGGMGTVYLGEHLTVGRRVAIKVLTHMWSRHPSVARRFRAEARAASAAGHPNIVEVFDAGELPDGRLFLVMEVLMGRNLYEEIESCGPLPIARACRIIRDIARAVKAAHDVGIIHRDLKPDNVMLVDRDGDGEFVKVLDFGVSASLDNSQSEARMTMPGQAIGTPEYMAPEQCKGRESTPAFDIYAIGAMFFELLTGAPPFVADSYVEIMANKTTMAAPSVASKRSQLPERLISLIDDALELDPAKRPASMHVFLARLDEVLRALPRDSGPRASRPVDVATIPPSPAAAPEPAQSIAARASERSGGTWAPILASAAVAALLASFGVAFASGMFGRAPAVATNPPSEAGLSAADPTPASSGEGDKGGGALPSAAAVEPSFTDPGSTEPGSTKLGSEPPPTSDAAGGAAADGTALGATDSENKTAAGTTGATDRESPPAGEGAGREPSAVASTGTKKPSVPKADTQACIDTRARASKQRSDGDFAGLHATLASKSCWSDRAEWTLLEVKALSELESWKACVSVGEKSRDPKVVKMVDLCRSRGG